MTQASPVNVHFAKHRAENFVCRQCQSHGSNKASIEPGRQETFLLRIELLWNNYGFVTTFPRLPTIGVLCTKK